jgi:hypothetical protein
MEFPCRQSRIYQCVLMKTHCLAISWCLLASAGFLHGNGGGYFRGGVENTGDVAGFEPKATEHIRILDEKLTLKLGPKEADVEVRYLMRNVTARKVKVRFGFPVEESFDNHYMMSPGEQKAPDGKNLIYCKNYQITAAGKAVKATWQGELKETREPHFKGVAGWLVSEVTFAANEEKPVMIRFQSGYPTDEFGVSDDGRTSAGIFRYRLSSAACWAGTIGTGRIVLEPDGIHPDDIRVLKPVNRFRKEGSRWVWNFEDLEPTLADDMEIEARPAEFIYGGRSQSGGFAHFETPDYQRANFIERGDKWSMMHSNYKVRASSTMAADGDITYVPENIREWWQNNAWSEATPGPGVGEWLEITPVEAKPLIALNLKPGYQKADLFKANARPKKIRIELNGEHHFDADIPDLEEEVVIPVSGYAKAVRKIRMTFTEVYPGNRFEDLCVSSVRLHVRLDKKPKIQPAR